MKTVARLLLTVLSLFIATATFAQRERIVGGPCDGCEGVFEGLPAEIATRAAIASAAESGERMVIDGVVRDARGHVVSDVIVYAYHTNDRGIYPPHPNFPRGSAAWRHGRLRGWARTDADGRFTFETIRPAGYPNTDAPAHVHFHVIEPGRCTYYIDDLLFDDDVRLTASLRRQMLRGRGGDGLGRPTRDANGVWHVRRDIVLGARVPGYPAR